MSLGVYPSQLIRTMIDNGWIENANQENIQPSTLDLTISDEIYKMKGVFLPKKNESINNIIKEGALFPADLDKPLECHGVYLIRLQEKLNLPSYVYACSNNKSSSGRINLQARLVANGVPQFDKIPRGYKGDLWIIVSPQSFSVKLRKGNKINQVRFFNSDTLLTVNEYSALYDQYPLIYDKDGNPIAKDDVDFDGDGGVTLTINLNLDIVGYKCMPSNSKVLDFNSFEHIPDDYFESILHPRNGHIILRRGEFYLLSTIEYLRVPPDFSVEMVAYDPSKGEFRSHYAGFFDPGWGYSSDGSVLGIPAVLEVFPQDNDFVLRHGQPICKMVYERLIALPDVIYGTQKAGSHYHTQKGPKLSKHFIQEEENKNQHHTIYENSNQEN